MAERVVAVIQARLGSTRLPRKELALIAGRPMLEHVVDRTQSIPGIAGVVLATTDSPADDLLEEFARKMDLRCVRGSEEDVLARFVLAVRETKADAVVRITADCPLLDPVVSGQVLARYLKLRPEVDYVSNVHPPTYPDGLDTEVFSVEALERAAREARRDSEKEHVTPYLWNTPRRFRIANVEYPKDLSRHRWTVDTKADLDFVREVFKALGPAADRPGMNDVLRVLDVRPDICALNADIRRNEGYDRSLAAERPL